MNNTGQENSYFYRYNPWDDYDGILALSETAGLPDACLFPEDGVPLRDPDKFFDYRLDLMLEAEAAIRSLLGLLVDFHQKRKLAQFLLGFCDLLEITYDKNTGSLRECRFRIDFSDHVSLLYSSRMCGCMILLKGKQDSLHSISPYAINDLRCILAEIWETIRELPIWETTSEDQRFMTIQHRLSIL